MATFRFEHSIVKSLFYCRHRMESKTHVSFRMCVNKALQAMLMVHLKPTWHVWHGVCIGHQELKNANLSSTDRRTSLTAVVGSVT